MFESLGFPKVVVWPVGSEKVMNNLWYCCNLIRTHKDSPRNRKHSCDSKHFHLNNVQTFTGIEMTFSLILL